MNDTFLITGTSKGLGFELAKNLILKSKKVVGLSRTKGKAAFFNSYSNFSYYKCDLSDVSSIYKTIQKISKEKICINNLINNSAKFVLSPDRKLSDKELIKIFQCNVIGTIILTRQLIKLYGSNLNRIFNVLSVSGLKGQYNQAIYSSTKHALKGYFDSLMQENLNNKTIINFFPGGMKTELWDGVKISFDKKNKFMQPKNVAEYILSHLDLPKEMFVKEVTFFPKNDWH